MFQQHCHPRFTAVRTSKANLSFFPSAEPCWGKCTWDQKHLMKLCHNHDPQGKKLTHEKSFTNQKGRRNLVTARHQTGWGCKGERLLRANICKWRRAGLPPVLFCTTTSVLAGQWGVFLGHVLVTAHMLPFWRHIEIKKENVHIYEGVNLVSTLTGSLI